MTTLSGESTPALDLADYHMAPRTDISIGTDIISTFCRAMNSKSLYLMSHYFSNNLVLDWFGRTICGKENVFFFLFEEMHLTNHDVIEVKSHAVDLRKNHSVVRAIRRYRQPSVTEIDNYDLDDSGFFHGVYDSNNSSFSSTGSQTPCSKLGTALSSLHVSKQNDDSLLWSSSNPIFKTPMNSRAPSLQALKRPSMALKNLKLTEAPKNLQFINAAGILTFINQDDFFNPGKIWTKPCNVQLGYCHQLSTESPISFSVLIYNNEMPCRRNLSQVFDQLQ